MKKIYQHLLIVMGVCALWIFSNIQNTVSYLQQPFDSAIAGKLTVSLFIPGLILVIAAIKLILELSKKESEGN